MPHSCLNEANNFCYICGSVTTANRRVKVSKLLEIAYSCYFRCEIGDQDKWWAPHYVCRNCYANLTQWLKNGSRHLTFGVPMVWREPTDHTTDCYFCEFPVKTHNQKSLKSVVYPDLPSARRPIPHSEELPKPISPQLCDLETAEEVLCSPMDDPMTDPDFTIPSHTPKMSMEQLHILSSDLVLSKKKSELLASKLSKQGALDPSVRVTSFRKRGTQYEDFF